MEGMGRYLLYSCTLEGLPFSYPTEFPEDTSYIFCEQHAHLWLLEDDQNFLATWDSHLCHFGKIILRFISNVHQGHTKISLGWGNHTDLQFCIENFQFSVQWRDFHIMIFIFSDDGILLFLLMSGMRQKIPRDPCILGNDIFPKGAVVFGYL